MILMEINPFLSKILLMRPASPSVLRTFQLNMIFVPEWFPEIVIILFRFMSINLL